jgi:SulP family sulfate permease
VRAECLSQNVELLFSGVRGPVRDAMQKAGLLAKIDSQAFFLNVNDAVDYAHQEAPANGETYEGFTMQVNT